MAREMANCRRARGSNWRSEVDRSSIRTPADANRSWERLGTTIEAHQDMMTGTRRKMTMTRAGHPGTKIAVHRHMMTAVRQDMKTEVHRGTTIEVLRGRTIGWELVRLDSTTF